MFPIIAITLKIRHIEVETLANNIIQQIKQLITVTSSQLGMMNVQQIKGLNDNFYYMVNGVIHFTSTLFEIRKYIPNMKE